MHAKLPASSHLLLEPVAKQHAVGQAGQRVVVGAPLELFVELADRRFGLLALGNVGGEAVPDQAPIIAAGRFGVQLAPAHAFLRQHDPVLDAPGLQRGGRLLQRAAHAHAIGPVDAAVQAAHVGLDLFGRTLEDLLRHGADVGAAQLAGGIHLYLEQRARDLLGQLGKQAVAALELFAQLLGDGDVGDRADHAHRPPVGVALDDGAARLDPDPVPLGMAQPVFVDAARFAGIEEGGQVLDRVLDIVRMHQTPPETAVVRPRRGDANKFLPARGQEHAVGLDVPVPHSLPRAGQRKAQPLLADAQLGTQARLLGGGLGELGVGKAQVGLRTFQFGDVVHCADQVGAHAVGGKHRCDRDCPDPLAGREVRHLFPAHRGLALDRLPIMVQDEAQRRFGNHVLDRLADHVARLQAGGVVERPVDGNKTKLILRDLRQMIEHLVDVGRDDRVLGLAHGEVVLKLLQALLNRQLLAGIDEGAQGA